MSLSPATGANTADFGRLFNRADPGSIVGQRDQSIVAPQALFFLNDPFAAETAKALAARTARDVPSGDACRIRRLYVVAMGRPPTNAEVELGVRIVAPVSGVDVWARYCLLILSTNEFLYVE